MSLALARERAAEALESRLAAAREAAELAERGIKDEAQRTHDAASKIIALQSAVKAAAEEAAQHQERVTQLERDLAVAGVVARSADAAKSEALPQRSRIAPGGVDDQRAQGESVPPAR